MNIIKSRYFIFFSLAFSLFVQFSCKQPEKDKVISGGWKIHQDGSFDLRYEDLNLRNCYPAFNDQNIRPLTVDIELHSTGGRITYELVEGKLLIELKEDSSGMKISSQLTGFNKAPDWVKPLAGGQVYGADRFYKQGFGFADASGVFEIPQPKERIERAVLKEDVWSYDSYLFTGLISPGGTTLVFSAFDHQDYQHRSTLYNKQHRIGLIDRHKDTNEIILESGFALEEIAIGPEGLTLPDIYIQKGKEPYATFHEQAMKMADFNEVELNISPRYYYCSWYEYHDEYNSSILFDMLKGIENMNTGIQTIQIDDGYAPLGDWLKINENFPEGMEKVAERIKEAGYDAGIWVGPFMVEENSFIFKEHKDWILKDLEGNLYPQWPNTYMLDTSHPDAFEYLRKVFITFRKMGFTTFKTDFLDWGLIDSKKVKRYTPGKTSVQYFMDVMRMIKEEIGEESYWLACISPFGQMIGFADGMRLSNDVSWNWSDESTGNMFLEMYAGQFFNNVLWQNDPDVLYLRDYNINLTKKEKYSIALYDGFMGGVINTSCRFHRITGEMYQLWKFLEPTDKRVTAKLPYWAETKPQIVALRDYPAGKAIYLVNIQNTASFSKYDLYELTGLRNPYVYDWGPDGYKQKGQKDVIEVSLNPHESQLIYLSESGAPPPEGLN